MFLIKSLREFTSRGSRSKRRQGDSGGSWGGGARESRPHQLRARAQSFQPPGVPTAAGSEPLKALCAVEALEVSSFHLGMDGGGGAGA